MSNKKRTADRKVLFRLRSQDAPFGVWVALIFAMTATLGPVSVFSQEVSVTKLVPNDGAMLDLFGIAVSIDGGTAVVGSILEDSACSDGDCDSGAAYVFSRKQNGWSQDAKLLPSAPSTDAVFGRSVLVDGDTILVGAPSTFNRDQPGSAYVFVRIGSIWTQEAKLIPSDSAPGDQFGTSLAKDGDTIVVGNPSLDSFSPDLAYVFVRDVDGWHEKARLFASDSRSLGFGRSVAIQGETIIVGAHAASSIGGPTFGGAAYSFFWDGETWMEQQKLLPFSANVGAFFGATMSLDGNALMIGAPGGGGFGEVDRPGTVHFFHRSDSIWEEQVELMGDPPSDVDFFGTSISLDGRIALVGASGDDDACIDDPNCSSGAAYFFVQGDSEWAVRTKITLPDRIPGEGFGDSVDLDLMNETAIFGAPGDDGACPSDPDCDSGAAYIYENIGVLLTPPPNAVPPQIWRQYR